MERIYRQNFDTELRDVHQRIVFQNGIAIENLECLGDVLLAAPSAEEVGEQ